MTARRNASSNICNAMPDEGRAADRAQGDAVTFEALVGLLVPAAGGSELRAGGINGNVGTPNAVRGRNNAIRSLAW